MYVDIVVEYVHWYLNAEVISYVHGGYIMEEKKLKTTEAHRKANMKWQKENYSRIPLDVPKYYHEYLKGVAKANDMSLNGFIKLAIEEKCENLKDEIPDEVIPRAIDWLKDHGHSDSEIVDFMLAIGKNS